MKHLTRKELLAAETFDYGYVQYRDYQSGSGDSWLNDIDTLERAEREGWEPSRIAQATNICEGDLWHYLRNFRDGKKIVNAPNPAEGFRRAVRCAIQSNLEFGTFDEEILVSYFGRRMSDLGYCVDMEGRSITYYLSELCPEENHSQARPHEHPVEWFRNTVRVSIRTAVDSGLNNDRAVEALVGRICCHAAQFGVSVSAQSHRLSDYSQELCERRISIQPANEALGAKNVSAGKSLQKVLTGLNGAIAGAIAGATFVLLEDVAGLVKGIAILAAIGAFIGIGGELKGWSRRIAYGRKAASDGLLRKLGRSAVILAGLYGLVGLIVGVSHLLLGKTAEGVAIWAIVGAVEGCIVGVSLWRLSAG